MVNVEKLQTECAGRIGPRGQQTDRPGERRKRVIQAIADMRTARDQLVDAAGDRGLTDEEERKLDELSESLQALQAERAWEDDQQALLGVHVSRPGERPMAAAMPRGDQPWSGGGRSFEIRAGSIPFETQSGGQLFAYAAPDRMIDDPQLREIAAWEWGREAYSILGRRDPGPHPKASVYAAGATNDLASGGYLAGVKRAYYFDLMRAKARVVQAGAIVAPVGPEVTAVGKLITDPVPAWRRENDSMTESGPTFGRHQLDFKNLGCLAYASEESLSDISALGELYVETLSKAGALELDRAALDGAGTKELTGVFSWDGVTVTDASVGTPTSFSPYAAAHFDVLGANHMPSAWVIPPADLELLDGLRIDNGGGAGTGQYLEPPRSLKSYFDNGRVFDTTQISGKSVIGDFSALWIFIRDDIKVEDSMHVKFEKHQRAYRLTMRADSVVVYPKAFATLGGLTTT